MMFFQRFEMVVPRFTTKIYPNSPNTASFSSIPKYITTVVTMGLFLQTRNCPPY